VASLDVPTFRLAARLSGRVPLVAVVSGYCFAGNAALAGVCDVIIATPEASLGMGGPAMIEGGGLGVVAPDEVGPMSIQVPNGVVDLLVEDEAAAVAAARRYLSYFGGSSADAQDAPPAGRATRNWSPNSTAAARRSAPPRRSRSTT
jgi:acetyl-CoA carboxylase carboxyltransferase component